jgi:hypothetical protein
VIVGDYSDQALAAVFAECTVDATVTNPPGQNNDETGTSVRWCTGRRQSWAAIWPQLRHFG